MARGRKKKVVEPELTKVSLGGDIALSQEVLAAIGEVLVEGNTSGGLQPTVLEDSQDWDFYKHDIIEYFDATKSYQLSGYRPVDEERGLDFNPDWFTEASRTKMATGAYCGYRPGSKGYRDFWTEEFRRCNEGYSVNGYRLTGDNYFFLNFYQLKNTKTDQAGEGRTNIFPRFFSKQYEYFHYIDLCEKLRKDVVALKARGVGFSEIAASLGVRLYSTKRESHVIYSAYDETHLEAVLRKCWEQLEFLNADTEGGMRHLRQKYNSDLHKKASKLNRQREEFGWMSDILGIVAGKPKKLRGDRVDRLFLEEAGSNPVLTATYLQSNALVEILGNKFGTRFVWGTGGDNGAPLAGLAKMFRNVEGYNGLPHRHNYNRSGEYSAVTGYFIPAFTFVEAEGCIDHRGVTNIKKAKEYYEAMFNKLLNDPTEYMKLKAEYCFCPEDALEAEGDNEFNKEYLITQKTRIEFNKKTLPPECTVETGYLEYKFKGEHSEQNIIGFEWKINPNGKVQILEHPQKDTDGQPYRNLYVAGIDGIDMGQRETSDKTRDPSDFAIVIKKRAFGLDSPKIVAIYKDRPQDVREAYRIALKLQEYYNCPGVIEASKWGYRHFLEEKKKLHKFLMRRPRATLADNVTGNSRQFGAPATETVIRHQLELIAAYVEDHCDHLWFLDVLNEAIAYSFEAKRKFDLIAAWGMAELADEELMGVVPREDIISKRSWEDIGFYYDERGIKRYGVIPKKEETKTIDLKHEYDQSRIRTSDPRYNT